MFEEPKKQYHPGQPGIAAERLPKGDTTYPAARPSL